MKRTIALVGFASIAGLVALAACTPGQITAAASTPAGQLFCAVQLAGGGTVVVGLIDAQASAVSPAAAPVAILATGVAKSVVDSYCAKAGGVAVSPPADPAAAPKIAVVTATG